MKTAEVSEKFAITLDTLRYYERVGLILPVNRNKSDIRDYSEIDIRRVDFIMCMRNAGLSIEVLIEFVGLVQQGDRTINARKEILKEQRELLAVRMKEMQITLDLLDHKLEVYESALLKKEKGIIHTEESEIIWFEQKGVHKCKNANLETVIWKSQRSGSAVWEWVQLMVRLNKQEMIALIRAAVERGVTFFDTAEAYGPFVNV
jgi:DNA-binding transcriptional MerR regulator